MLLEGELLRETRASVVYSRPDGAMEASVRQDLHSWAVQPQSPGLGSLDIRQLLPSVRERKEFLRMSLMKLPGHASDSLSEKRRTS